LDHYPSLDAIRSAFIEFVNKVPFYGAAIVCLDDANVQSLLPEIRRRTITYGTTAQADFEATEIACGAFASDFRLRHHTTDLGRFHLRIPGRHNVLNATAAIAVAMELEVKPDVIREALATFSGVDRRFQMRGKERGVTVVDDYGHHPTEIRATLAAARGLGARVLVVFQPHRYSRTATLREEFGSAFGDAARVWVLDIYPAGEKPLPGISAHTIVEAAAGAGASQVGYAASPAEAVAAVAAEARAGDVVLTLGAGDVGKLADAILERLRQGAAALGRGRG
jgi:UDP-N-acetylmuramate--alanine ligase